MFVIVLTHDYIVHAQSHTSSDELATESVLDVSNSNSNNTSNHNFFSASTSVWRTSYASVATTNNFLPFVIKLNVKLLLQRVRY